MSFAKLKKTRNEQLQKMSEAAKEQTTRTSYVDERFWEPTIDKAGNGFAVIRFLPTPTDEPIPWTRFWDHGFQGPTGKWYIEKSRTSINEKDPVSEYNSELWDTGIEENRDQARTQKRRLHYVSNILVISDSGNPTNNGKRFLYKFGKTIFDKIDDAMHPQFEDDVAMSPFDLWEGANFKIKIMNKDGWRNYDKSEFDAPSALFDGDEAKLEVLYNSVYSLKEFTDPASYKSYDELKKRLNDVLLLNDTKAVETPATTNTDDGATIQGTRAEEPAGDVVVEEEQQPLESGSGSTMDYFKSVAERRV